jgi:SOS response regulatory protein OraA/RecX
MYKLEERQKLYLKVMPRLTIFSEPEKPKMEDRLRERLKQRGLTDEIVDKVLEGLVLN